MMLAHLKPISSGVLVTLLMPLNAYAVVDQWEGICYEEIHVAGQRIRELGACTAYDGVSGTSRVIRGILLQNGDALHGWSDADSSRIQVNEEPGIFETDRSTQYPPFSIRRDRFCMGTKTGKSLICFEPKMEAKDR